MFSSWFMKTGCRVTVLSYLSIPVSLGVGHWRGTSLAGSCLCSSIKFYQNKRASRSGNGWKPPEKASDATNKSCRYTLLAGQRILMTMGAWWKNYEWFGDYRVEWGTVCKVRWTEKGGDEIVSKIKLGISLFLSEQLASCYWKSWQSDWRYMISWYVGFALEVTLR